MTLEALCVETRKGKLGLDNTAIAQMLLAGDADPLDAAQQAIQRLQRDVVAVSYGQRTDVRFSDGIEDLLDEHDQKAVGAYKPVAHWPMADLDKATGGLQDDDYVVLYGRPKCKKSWILSYLITEFYLQGKFPLIYTKEMTAFNLYRRILACLGKFDYQDLRTGGLPEDERNRAEQVRRAIKDLQMHQDMVVLNGKDSQGAGDTVEWLHAKVDKYKPDMVMIDGLYLMSDSKGSKNQKDNIRVQNISRAVRQMILDTGIPVVCTMQATRTAAGHKDANLDEIAFSDSLAQDATVAFRVINENKNPDYGNADTVSLLVGGSREWQFSGCRMYAECATNFGYIGALDPDEAEKLKNRDDRKNEKEQGVMAATRAKTVKDAPDAKALKAKLKRDADRNRAARIYNLAGG